MNASEYNVKDRPRRLDVSKLTPEEADNLGQQINEKVRVTSDKILDELNKFLKIYGIKANVQIVLDEIKLD